MVDARKDTTGSGNNVKKIIVAALLAVGATSLPTTGHAQGSDPYLGQLAWVAFDFAPRGWAECNGQMLPISQNTALFSLLGITYGGDGKTTFALPDMRGRMPVHVGAGPGLTERTLGWKAGAESVTLTAPQLPVHTHSLMGTNQRGNKTTVEHPATGSHALARSAIRDGSGQLVDSGTLPYRASPILNAELTPGSVADTGGGQPHDNMPPYLGLRCIIALQGIFPSRP